MGSLVRIRLSDLNPTLELLEHLGVSEEDFDEIRTKPVFAREVAEVFSRRRQLIAKVTGADELDALDALEEISDQPTLAQVVKQSQLTVIKCRAVRKMKPYEAYHFARLHENMEVVKAALSQTDDNGLWGLWCDSACNGMRNTLVAQEYTKRHGKPPQRSR